MLKLHVLHSHLPHKFFKGRLRRSLNCLLFLGLLLLLLRIRPSKVGRARFLQDRCRDILLSNDPVSRILRDESKCAPGNAEVQSNLELIGESKVKNLDPKAGADVADEVPNTVRVLDSVGKDNCNPPSVGGAWLGMV